MDIVGSYSSSSTGAFAGIFNGNGHKITNLWINRTSANYAIGFFGNAEYAQIKNLGVEMADGKSISGYSYVGGIVGNAYMTNITNVYSTGNISGYYKVGGIVGDSYIINITNSYSTGSITGNMTNARGLGGIAGWISDYSNVLNNVAINGLIKRYYEVNRVIGVNNDYTGQTFISNNFALNSMTGEVSIQDYLTKNGFSNGGNVIYHGIDKTIGELKTRSTYETGLGWQFGDNDTAPWKIDSDKNNGYPYFYWQEL
ncbi:MAG: hypothetical protein LBL65_03990 [Campylobacteraceae bacterium]|nr:hypothetical protein [Campylobacteraceae bacterium]